MLASPEAKQFLTDIWQPVKDRAPEDAGPADFSIDEVQVHPCRAGAFPCAVIEMPEPRGVTETYFTAIVLLVDPSQLPQAPSELPIRYFTLEKGFSLDETPRTVPESGPAPSATDRGRKARPAALGSSPVNGTSPLSE